MGFYVPSPVHNMYQIWYCTSSSTLPRLTNSTVILTIVNDILLSPFLLFLLFISILGPQWTTQRGNSPNINLGWDGYLNLFFLLATFTFPPPPKKKFSWHKFGPQPILWKPVPLSMKYQVCINIYVQYLDIQYFILHLVIIKENSFMFLRKHSCHLPCYIAWISWYTIQQERAMSTN